MSQLAMSFEAPPVADPDSPLAIAVEISANLRAAEREISSVAADLAEREPLGDRIQAVLERMNARADAELDDLNRLLAEIKGCTVEQLPAVLAKEKAEQDAERAAIRAARTAPAPRAKKSKTATVTAAPEPVAPPRRKLTDRQRELLRDFEVRGNVARFTRDEQIQDWAAVKEVFVALGAKWRTGKPGGFHFPEHDDAPEKVRLAVATGEILDPKAAGFFPTPEALADKVVALAGIRPGHRVLEPSAGRGALALAVRRACLEAVVGCVELLPDNRAELGRLGFRLIGSDFLALKPRDIEGPWDAVVMNPPFGGRDDIRHIRHAATFLRPRIGRLVSVASASVQFRDDAIGIDFRAWVAEQGGRIEDLPEGSFLESGTGVRTCLVILGGAA